MLILRTAWQVALEIQHPILPYAGPSEPSMVGECLPVSEIQVIDFGCTGRCGQDTRAMMTARPP